LKDSPRKLTNKEKLLIKIILKIAPKGGCIWFSPVRKFYREGIGPDVCKQKEQLMFKKILRMLPKQYYKYHKFTRANRDLYLHIAPCLISQLRNFLRRHKSVRSKNKGA